MPEELPLDKSFAIIGDEDVITGFKALGFKIYIAKGPADFQAIFDKIVKDKVSICLVQDNIYKETLEYIDSYKQLSLPIFVPFSKEGKADLLNKLIKDIRLKATGAF